MIKVNVLLSNITWKKYLKDPLNFIDKKITSLNKKNKQFKNKILICSLLLSGSNEIKLLNNKFRGKNKSTDILSFPFYKKNKFTKILKRDKEIYLGDIIINLNKVKFKSNRKQFKEELIKLFIHGLIHLFGYKHKKDRDYYKMRSIEKKYLNYIN